MRKATILFTAAVLAAASAYGQSAKSAVQVNYSAVVDANCDTNQWSKIAEVSIKTSQQKDLVLGASLETVLFTRTLVRSEGGTSDTSTVGRSHFR